MEISETKHDFLIGEYTARVYWGDYGTHTDWFKGENFIKSEEVPDEVQDTVDRMIEEIF